jgi:hypothetical protein
MEFFDVPLLACIFICIAAWVRGYCLKTNGGPLTRFAWRLTVTSTRSAILMKGMPLFIPNSLRSNAIVPLTSPWPDPLSPETTNVSVRAWTPRE